jgi:hypothetical protein
MGLTELFLHYFPLYNKFRAVTMILVMAELSMPLLAFVALNQFLQKVKDEKALKQLQLSLYIVGGLLLFFILFAGSLFSFSGKNDEAMGLPDWLLPAIQADRLSMFRTDAIRSLIFILLTFGLLWAYAKGKLKMAYVLVLIPLLILVDMWPVDKRYINDDDFVRKSQADNPYQPTKADLAILKDTDPSYRVYNFKESFDGSARTSYFHKNIGGYHGAKMRRYQELVDHFLVKERADMAGALSGGGGDPEEALQKASVFNMMNTRYYIINPNGDPLRNPYALGNAWFVKGYRIVGNADEEIGAMENFDPANEAIIDRRFENELKGFTPGNSEESAIALTAYNPDKMEYEYSTKTDGLAVFSEVYYPEGWKAYVDGKETPHFRANYLLRAMVLPAGDHRLEFRFEPKSYYTGQKVSLAASLIVILLTLGLAFYYIFPETAARWQGKIKKY